MTPTPERQGRTQPIGFPVRAAAVDIGSNAIRFIAAEFSAPDAYQVLESERVPVRLGQSAFRRGVLDSDRMHQAVDAVIGFRARMDALDIHEYRAVATSAVRESRNGKELTERIRGKTGIRVEAISGAEEGRLVWRAIRSRLDLAGQRWLLIDLGGGSVEVSFADSEELLWTESLPIGTVRLLEALGPGTERPTEGLRRLLDERMGSLADSMTASGTVRGIVATGGNAEALADLAAVDPDPQGVRRLAVEQLREVVERVGSLTVGERIDRLNLREDRADVILPAGLVYERLAALSASQTLVVPGVGLKEGVLLDLLDDLRSHPSYEERHAREVESGAIALGRRHGFEEAHARQVTHLALELFDALRELHRLGEADRRILIAAGILHDVGKVVAHRKHHRHSRYLIRHAEPPGLTRHEIELVSLVARYHRRARPKRSHEGYGDLDSADRQRVRKLASLLRVADALDQDHRQQVKEMWVEVGDDVITLRLRGEVDLRLEEWSLKRKEKLFRRVYERALCLVPV